jgi:hypothetical protein
LRVSSCARPNPSKIDGIDSRIYNPLDGARLGRIPYRAGGSYHGVVATLQKLGMGKMHPASALVKAYPAVVGTEAWKAFKAKDPRNDETGKNAEGRIIQNAIVVNRPDYGMPLRAVGLEVRKDRNADGYLFGLFTIKPQRPTEIVRESKAKPPKAAKGKAARKPKGK